MQEVLEMLENERDISEYVANHSWMHQKAKAAIRRTVLFGRAIKVIKLQIPKDITPDLFHPKYDVISCPHCHHSLTHRAVFANRYCFMCGGRFGDLIYPEGWLEDEEEEDE
ncbi:MAG: hypothetical protein MJZ26_12165 [Fibrobacter sp.]|nr:hypothetical protein [Fibrobacter sp.]